MALPASLFDATLRFIALHADLIESLAGFPPEIGKHIFRKTVTVSFFLESELPFRRLKILKVFLEAYGDCILPSLSIASRLLFINEYANYLLLLMEHVSELDLSYCNLGPNHEIINSLCHFVRLRKLSLVGNCLDDTALRKLTLPVKHFGKGPACLEELHLGSNRSLTDKIVPWLARLKNLQFLQLTGTGITEAGFSQLEVICNMARCEDNQQFTQPVVTSGWAKEVIEALIARFEQNISQKKRKVSSSFYHRSTLLDRNLEKVVELKQEIVFRRISRDETGKKDDVMQPAKKLCTRNDTCEDLFALYR